MIAMTIFYKHKNKNNADIFEARGDNDASLYVEIYKGRMIYGSVGSAYSGTWAIGCAGLTTLGDLRRLFWKLHKGAARKRTAA